MSEVCEMPGKVEFDLICEDIHIAQSGALAWVRAGLRLRCVKEALPHGEFMQWMDVNCASMRNLTSKHLCRAKTTADRLVENLESHGTEVSNEEMLSMLDSPDSKLREWIEGKTPTQLNLELKQAKQLTKEQERDEAEAKEYCLQKWETDPSMRDEWEPKVIGGDRTYQQARMGMNGQETTKGKKREETQTLLLLEKNFSGLDRHWKGWELAETKERKEKLLLNMCQGFENAPIDAIEGLYNFLKTKLK